MRFFLTFVAMRSLRGVQGSPSNISAVRGHSDVSLPHKQNVLECVVGKLPVQCTFRVTQQQVDRKHRCIIPTVTNTHRAQLYFLRIRYPVLPYVIYIAPEMRVWQAPAPIPPYDNLFGVTLRSGSYYPMTGLQRRRAFRKLVALNNSANLNCSSWPLAPSVIRLGRKGISPRWNMIKQINDYYNVMSLPRISKRCTSDVSPLQSI